MKTFIILGLLSVASCSMPEKENNINTENIQTLGSKKTDSRPLTEKNVKNLLGVKAHFWNINWLDLKIYEFRGSYKTLVIETRLGTKNAYPDIFDCSQTLPENTELDGNLNIIKDFSEYGTSVYEYDQDNRIINRSTYNFEGEHQVSESYFYERLTNSLQIAFFTKNGVTTERIFYDEFGRIASIQKSIGDLKTYINYSYNEEGFVCETKTDDKTIFLIEYQYNAFGDWIESAVYRPEEDGNKLQLIVNRKFS